MKKAINTDSKRLNNKPIFILSEKDAKMQSIYLERIEKFLAIAEVSFALKNAPRIYPKKND